MADEAVKRIIIDLIPESKPFFEVMPEYDGERQTVILGPGLVQKAFWEIIQWGSGSNSPKGLIGHDFEDYLTKNIGGDGSFSVDGRDFDGGIGNRWWEAKSGRYWDMLEINPDKLANFKSDMGDRLRIAIKNGATYELFSNTPIPDSIKQWLTNKGISYTELLD